MPLSVFIVTGDSKWIKSSLLLRGCLVWRGLKACLVQRVLFYSSLFIYFFTQVIRLSVTNSCPCWDCDFISILQEAIIGGLQSETTYSVTVAAYTTKGDGARSKAKVITTTGAGQRQFSLGYPEENMVHSMSICLLGIRVSSLWLWTDASIFLFLRKLWGESSLSLRSMCFSIAGIIFF